MTKSKAVAKAKTTAMGMPNLAGMAKGLKQTRQAMPSFGGKPYMKFGKDGEWSCGQGGDAVNGELVILNTSSLKGGYVCWTDHDKKKNEKLGEEMQLVSMGLIDPEELPDMGWPWKAQQSVEGRFLEGDQEEFSYNTSSGGGLEAMAGVIDAIMARIEDGEEVFLFPVVRLEDDNYEHKQWGKTYKPILEIVGWADVEGNLEDDDVLEEEPEQIEPPKKKAKKKPAKKTKTKPEPEPEPEEDEDEDEEVDEPEEEEEDEDEPEAEEPPRRRRRR